MKDAFDRCNRCIDRSPDHFIYKKKTLQQVLRVLVSQFLLVIMQFSKEKDSEKESVP